MRGLAFRGDPRPKRNAPLSSSSRFALAALAVLGLAGTARAQTANPVFTAFHDACMVPDLAPGAVNSAASAHDWKSTNADGHAIDGFVVSNKVSKARTVGDANLTLYDWTGAKGAVTASECQVQVSAASLAALQGAASAALGFAPAETSPQKVTFRYAGPGASPAAITDKSQFDVAAGAGGLYILTLSASGKGAFISLLKIHK